MQGMPVGWVARRNVSGVLAFLLQNKLATWLSLPSLLLYRRWVTTRPGKVAEAVGCDCMLGRCCGGLSRALAQPRCPLPRLPRSTVEFLANPQREFHFLEMNTRLQVIAAAVVAHCFSPALPSHMHTLPQSAHHPGGAPHHGGHHWPGPGGAHAARGSRSAADGQPGPGAALLWFGHGVSCV